MYSSDQLFFVGESDATPILSWSLDNELDSEEKRTEDEFGIGVDRHATDGLTWHGFIRGQLQLL